MRILHTSDWHLGKNLEGASRLEEQEQFIEDFIHIVDENCIDMVIISGDIYDSSNPPAKAEKLFYKALKGISKNGKRLTLVIAGNHDNPDRLSAASPLAYEQDRKSTRLNSSHANISYAVFCLKKKTATPPSLPRP